MDSATAPRPASTVLALRDAPEGYEVLMLRRNLNSDFVGGAYVFPGGAVDEGDRADEIGDLVIGPDDEAASALLSLEAGGLSYLVAALRELFEEAGLLIACDASGRPFAPDAPGAAARLSDARRALNARETTFAQVVRAEGLLLDLRALVYLSHWVTPQGPPRRFDTRFFVARAPERQIAAHDAGETVADTWLRPRDALEAHERGELEMIFPTIRTLMSIAEFDTVDAVLDHVGALESVTRTEPRIVERDGRLEILLPGDEGYDGN